MRLTEGLMLAFVVVVRSEEGLVMGGMSGVLDE